MNHTNGTVEFSGWLLTPEGAAVRPEEGVAVIADVHLGYEWARGKAGDSIPAHSLNETRLRLDRMFQRVASKISTLIVAGDFVESHRPCRKTERDAYELRRYLESLDVGLIILAGNHDPALLVDQAPDSSKRTTYKIGEWTIGHGHQPIAGDRTISGHIHPVIRLAGLTAGCFLASESRLILPAFSPNASGLDVLCRSSESMLGKANFRCFASTGDEILDFGPLFTLRSRTQRTVALV